MNFFLVNNDSHCPKIAKNNHSTLLMYMFSFQLSQRSIINKTHVKHAHPEYTSLISQKSIKLRQASVSILYISLNAKFYFMN